MLEHADRVPSSPRMSENGEESNVSNPLRKSILDLLVRLIQHESMQVVQQQKLHMKDGKQSLLTILPDIVTQVSTQEWNWLKFQVVATVTGDMLCLCQKTGYQPSQKAQQVQENTESLRSDSATLLNQMRLDMHNNLLTAIKQEHAAVQRRLDFCEEAFMAGASRLAEQALTQATFSPSSMTDCPSDSITAPQPSPQLKFEKNDTDETVETDNVDSCQNSFKAQQDPDDMEPAHLNQLKHLDQLFSHIQVPKFLQPLAIWLASLEEPERTGMIADFVAGRAFENLCMAVIVINTATIFYTTNYSITNLNSELPVSIKVLEYLFTVLYVFELLCKIIVHRLYFFCNSDYRWNTLDFFLVFLAVFDVIQETLLQESSSMSTAPLRIIRVLRVSKTVRIIRLFRFFAELRLILNCVVGSLSALFWSVILLLGITSVCAIVLVQFVTSYLVERMDDHGEIVEELLKNFGSVQKAILALVESISGGTDWGDHFDLLSNTGGVNAAIFLGYVMFVWLAIANIITSIYVDKAMKLAQPDIEQLLADKHKEDYETANELRSVFSRLDANGTGTLSLEELQEALCDYKLISYFEMKGLRIHDAERFFSMLANVTDSEEVSIDSFVGGCLKMKGVALNVDLVMLRYEIQMLEKMNVRCMDDCLKQLADLGTILSKRQI